MLKRFKKSLRLSLNAAEDLLVNGAREPDDRGVLKHLFAKVDRQVVHAALSREPFASDRGLRGVFLAGIVRLRPSFDTLLAYLETVADGDRRAAAEAFGLTVQRLAFSEASAAQLDQIVALVHETFEGHDRTQAMLGLIDEAHEALHAHRDQIEPVRWRSLAPLVAAHGVVVRGEAVPESEEGRALIAKGVDQWLSAPAPVLRSYPEPLRWRLAEYAVRAAKEIRPHTVPAALMASLPATDSRFARLAQPRAEALARSGQLDAARALLRPVAEQNHPPAAIKTLARVLAWPMVGKATFDPTRGPGRLRRAFELRIGAHGWGRTAPADAAGALVAEARRQSDLLVPGIAIVLGHGLADDGSAYVIVGGRGRPWVINPSAPMAEVLQLILDAALIARAVDSVGLTLPDLHPARFLIHGRPGRLTLADLAGVKAVDATQAALTHGPRILGLARDVARDAEGRLREDLPAAVAARLVGNTPLPLLVRELVTALGRDDTAKAPPPKAPAPKKAMASDEAPARAPATGSTTSDERRGRQPNRRRRRRGNKTAGSKPPPSA